MFDPMNPPRMGNTGLEEGQLMLHQDLAKLSLDPQQQPWVLSPRSPPAPPPSSYILVNPMTPLPPHYVPYIYPGYQVSQPVIPARRFFMDDFVGIFWPKPVLRSRRRFFGRLEVEPSAGVGVRLFMVAPAGS